MTGAMLGGPPGDLERRLVAVAIGDADDHPAAPVDDRRWADLLAWARTHRVVGLVHRAAPFVIELTEEQHRALDAVYRSECVRTMMVDASLPAVASRLDAEGIPWSLLKGAVTAHFLYDAPTERQYVDLDLLVDECDLDRTLLALAPLTATPAPLQTGPARQWAVKECAIVDDRGVEIDVHFGVQAALVSSRLDTAALLSGRRTIAIDHLAVPVLDDPALLVHAALHLVSVNAKASGVADVALLCRRVRPDDPQLEALLASPPARRQFLLGIELASAWVGLPVIWAAYLDAHPHALWGRLYRWVHTTEDRVRVVNACIGPRRLRRLGETLWPQRAFLDQQGMTRWGNLRRLIAAGRDAARPAGESSTH